MNTVESNLYPTAMWNEMHNLACRHCMKKSAKNTVEQKRESYSSVLTCSIDVEAELKKIEAIDCVVNGISFFCEVCRQLSVISFEFEEYQKAQIQNLFAQHFSSAQEYYKYKIMEWKNTAKYHDTNV